MSKGRGNGDSEISDSGYYNVSGFNQYGILVPRTVPVEIVVRMVAAIISEGLGNVGVDYQLKEYRKIIEKTVKPQYVEGSAKRFGIIDQILGNIRLEKDKGNDND